jgi:hypothetical protein
LRVTADAVRAVDELVAGAVCAGHASAAAADEGKRQGNEDRDRPDTVGDLMRSNRIALDA